MGAGDGPRSSSVRATFSRSPTAAARALGLMPARLTAPSQGLILARHVPGRGRAARLGVLAGATRMEKYPEFGELRKARLPREPPGLG
jgi:hypothetical protein